MVQKDGRHGTASILRVIGSERGTGDLQPVRCSQVVRGEFCNRLVVTSGQESVVFASALPAERWFVTVDAKLVGFAITVIGQ